MVRRIVTGQTQADDNVIARVEDVEAPQDGGRISVAVLWGADALPTLPALPSPDLPEDYVPPAGGIRVLAVVFPPGRAEAFERHPAGAARRGETEGRFTVVDGDSGTHFTDSVDVLFVLSGEVVMTLDDRSVRLGVGDCVVQIGAAHAWRNEGSVPCFAGVVVLGVERR